MHFLHNVHPGCLWAPKGQRPALTANSGRRRYSVLGGYSVTGEYVGVETDGMVNAQTVLSNTLNEDMYINTIATDGRSDGEPGFDGSAFT